MVVVLLVAVLMCVSAENMKVKGHLAKALEHLYAPGKEYSVKAEVVKGFPGDMEEQKLKSKSSKKLTINVTCVDGETECDKDHEVEKVYKPDLPTMRVSNQRQHREHYPATPEWNQDEEDADKDVTFFQHDGAHLEEADEKFSVADDETLF